MVTNEWCFDNEFYTSLELKVFGHHNILNSLASIGIAIKYGIDKKYVKKALEEYSGAHRRFEYLGDYKKAHIFDDFAHHPTEILSTYNSTKNIVHNKTWAVFQSHTYSRTYNLLEEFAHVLAKFDNVIVCKIYPAREKNIWGVKESDLVEFIKHENENVVEIDEFSEVAKYLEEKVQEDDIIITIGAGPVNKVAEILINE